MTHEYHVNHFGPDLSGNTSSTENTGGFNFGDFLNENAGDLLDIGKGLIGKQFGYTPSPGVVSGVAGGGPVPMPYRPTQPEQGQSQPDSGKEIDSNTMMYLIIGLIIAIIIVAIVLVLK